jgi:hypothetical protein
MTQGGKPRLCQAGQVSMYILGNTGSPIGNVIVYLTRPSAIVRYPTYRPKYPQEAGGVGG